MKDIFGRVNFLLDRKLMFKIKYVVIYFVLELCEVVFVCVFIFSVVLMLLFIFYCVNIFLFVSDVKCMIIGVSDNIDEFKLFFIGV